MDQSGLENFVITLINCNSNDSEVQRQSEQIIMEMRNQNIFGFLNSLLWVLQNSSVPPQAKQISLILSNQTFRNFQSPDPSQKAFEFFEAGCPGLLTQFITVATSLFSFSPYLSSNLFSSLTIIVYLYDDHSQIFPTLIQQLGSVTDVSFLIGAYLSIENITCEFELEPEFYQPILVLIFTMFGNATIPVDLKSVCVKILSNLIRLISDVFSNPQNTETIVNVLKYSIIEFGTKSAGYKCVAQVVKYRFPTFALIAEAAIGASMCDLEQLPDDSDVISGIFQMIVKLTNRYSDGFDDGRREVLLKSFPAYFGQLIKLAMMHGDDVSTMNQFDPSEGSLFVMRRIIHSFPDATVQPVFQFAQGNVQSENANLRELSLKLFAFIVDVRAQIGESDSDEPLRNGIEQLTRNIIHLFPAVLLDGALRVRASSLYLLRKVIKNFYDEFKEFVCSLSVVLLQSLVQNAANPYIASCVCKTLAKIRDLPNCKDVILTMLRFANTQSYDFAIVLFESISRIVPRNSRMNQALPEVVPHFVEVVKLGILDQNYHHNQSLILKMFSFVCVKAETFLSPFFAEICPLLVQAYMQTQDCEAVSALTALAIAVQNDPSIQFPLDELFNIIIQLCQRSDSNYHIFTFVNTTSELCEKLKFDLSRFIPRVGEEIAKIMEARLNDLTIYSNLLFLLFKIFQKYFEFVAFVVVNVLRMIEHTLEAIENAPDRYERIEFLLNLTMFINQFYTQAGMQNSVDWFQLGCRILAAVADFIDVDTVYNDNKYNIRMFAELFCTLSQLQADNPEKPFMQFLMGNTSVQQLFMNMMDCDECKAILPIEFKQMINQEEQ